MAGSPDADWFEAMRAATIDVVVHCSIALSGTTMDFHNWASGGLDATVTGDPLLSSITSVTQQVDPIKRNVQASELSLELLDDGKIRGLVSSQNFLNTVVTVKLGAVPLALSEFVTIFKGSIARLQPVEGKITIKLQTLESLIKDKKNFRTYYNKHPFEIVNQMLQDSGVDSGDINSTAFTPSTYSADISHYCFASMVTGSDFENDMFWDYEMNSNTGAAGVSYIHDWTYHVLRFRPFVDEVMMLTRTSMFVNTDGDVTLKHFNSSEAVAKHFTTDEYSDFEQVEADVPIYNKMNCAFRNSGPQRFVRKDNTSITNYDERPYETPILYLAPYSNYYENGGTPQAGDIVPGFAGVKNLLTSQSTEAPSADRPVYWLHRQEVIKATGAFTATNQYYNEIYNADGDGTGGSDLTPTANISNKITDMAYFRLVRAGAGSNAYGRENGRPVFALVLSSEASYQLQTEAGFRDDVRYNNAAVSDLIAPLGVEKSFRGFYHMIDDLAPRFTVDGNGVVDRVQPYGASSGVVTTNASYETADYEAAYVVHPDVMECAIPEPVSGSQGLAFDPASYSRDFKWKNLPDEVRNPDGLIGFFRGVMASASKPVKTDFGYVILFKRTSATPAA